MKFFFIIFAMIFSVAAEAGYSCHTADNQTEIQMNLGFPTVMVTLHSRPIDEFYQIAYLYELGRLEIVKEQNGQAVLEKTLTGYRGLLWAPTSGANQVWSFELSFAPAAALLVIDPAGKSFAFDLICNAVSDLRIR